MHFDYVHRSLRRLAITSLRYSLLLGHATHAHITYNYLVHEIHANSRQFIQFRKPTPNTHNSPEAMSERTMCVFICANCERLDLGVFEFSVCPYYTTQLRVRRVP